MSQLEDEFKERIQAVLDKCHELGYHPTDFERLLTRASAIHVAEKLIMSGEIQTGLRRLAEMSQLELSVEAVMLEPRFESLFSDELRKAAQWRLKQVKP